MIIKKRDYRQFFFHSPFFVSSILLISHEFIVYYFLRTALLFNGIMAQPCLSCVPLTHIVHHFVLSKLSFITFLNISFYMFPYQEVSHYYFIVNRRLLFALNKMTCFCFFAKWFISLSFCLKTRASFITFFVLNQRLSLSSYLLMVYHFLEIKRACITPHTK